MLRCNSTNVFVIFVVVAETAIEMNAKLNNVELEINTSNLIGQVNAEWDVVLFGDLFYDQEFTNQLTDWIEKLHASKKTILIGDPGRIYFSNHPIKENLKLVFQVELHQQSKDENNGLTEGFVWMCHS